MTKILEIKDLHAEVEGKQILKGLNLTLESGKINALMGPNGSGKSTLANNLFRMEFFRPLQEFTPRNE